MSLRANAVGSFGLNANWAVLRPLDLRQVITKKIGLCPNLISALLAAKKTGLAVWKFMRQCLVSRGLIVFCQAKNT